MPRGLSGPTLGSPYRRLALSAVRTRVRATTSTEEVRRSAKRCFLLMPETGLCVEVTDPEAPVGVPVSPGKLLAAVVLDNLVEIYNG